MKCCICGITEANYTGIHVEYQKPRGRPRIRFVCKSCIDTIKGIKQ